MKIRIAGTSGGRLAACSVAVAVLAVAGARAEEPDVTGRLIANGEEVELPYVYVYEVDGHYDESDPSWEIVFAAEEIAERDLDEFFLDFPYVKVKLTRPSDPEIVESVGELEVFSQNIKLSKLDSNLSGGQYPKLELTEAGPEQFAGRIYIEEPYEFFDDTFQYDFTFSAGLSNPNAPIGDPLPAGGGAPGKAYAEWVETIHSGDLERIGKLLPAEMKAMLEQEIAGKSAEEIAETLELLTLFTPPEVEVVGGSTDGAMAILEVTGSQQGEETTGEITMTLVDGRWVVAGEKWQ